MLCLSRRPEIEALEAAWEKQVEDLKDRLLLLSQARPYRVLVLAARTLNTIGLL